MKKHLLTLCLFIISNFLHAQDIAFIPSTYIGGYNVSCNGATDGTLQAILNGYGAHPIRINGVRAPMRVLLPILVQVYIP